MAPFYLPLNKFTCVWPLNKNVKQSKYLSFQMWLRNKILIQSVISPTPFPASICDVNLKGINV